MMFVDCGTEPLRIRVGKRDVSFEMHRYCGPMPVRADGRDRQRTPARFWMVVQWWIDQGERVDDFRRCLYEPPPNGMRGKRKHTHPHDPNDYYFAHPRKEAR